MDTTAGMSRDAEMDSAPGAVRMEDVAAKVIQATFAMGALAEIGGTSVI